MSSRKQIEANQKNAQSCTGPTSQAGKARSSQNALKTGIDAKSEVIRVESQAEYDELIAEFYGRYHPTVPEERMLVDALIRTEWLSRRYMCTEKSVWERGFNETDSTSLGLVFMRSEKFFNRLDRRINSAQRNSQKALKQLRELRANPDAMPDTPVISDPAIQDAVAPDAVVPSAVVPDALPNRDCKGAAPEIPNPHVEPEPLNPELVSFLTPASESPIQTPSDLSEPVAPIGAASETPANNPEKEEIPPVAA
jgi:hypothetical protein